MPKVKIGGDERTLHEFNGRKAIRAAKIIRGVSRAWPEILSTIASFRRQYEAENVVVMDRATARQQFPPRPLMDPASPADPLRDVEGKLLMHDPLGHLTDADWEKSGNVLKMPKSPSFGEEVAAAFPVAFDHAEEQLLQLMALCVVDAEDLGKAARQGGAEAVDALLGEAAEDLQDKASLGELLELAVVGAELVEQQVAEKVEELGDRVGNLARVVGIKLPTRTPAAPPTADGESSTTRPDSSTSSPTPTDGESDEPSTELAGASSAASSAV